MKTAEWIAHIRSGIRTTPKGNRAVTLILNRNKGGYGFISVRGVEGPRPFGDSKEHAIEIFSAIYDELAPEEPETTHG